MLFDRFFGGGTARALAEFEVKEASSHLSLWVGRQIDPQEIALALLVSRIEVRGYDATGTLVYSKDLEGFIFGDSQSGFWSRELNDLPATIQQVKINFLGNYE